MSASASASQKAEPGSKLRDGLFVIANGPEEADWKPVTPV